MLEMVGELGVPLFDFYAMTWLEWCAYSKGLNKTKIKEWEHTRTIAWMLYKANSDPKKSAKIMTAWWALPTDQNYKPKTKRRRGRRLTEKEKQAFYNSMR